MCVCLGACQWKLSGSSVDADLEVKVCRYDKLLNEYVSLNSFTALQKMNTEYPQETKLLVEEVLGVGMIGDDGVNDRLRAFYADTNIVQLTKDAMVKFEDMKPIEHDLTEGFRALKKELPDLVVPRVYAQLSALNQSVVVGDGILGFSVDKYMGSDYPLYARYYYDFQRRTMEPSRIVPDCFMYYLISEYPLIGVMGSNMLIEHMLHAGKVHWVIKKILDYDSFAEEMGYTKAEEEWCEENEERVWNYLLDSGYLTSFDPMLIRTYVLPAPNTYTFGADAPYQLGVWLGVQIVDSYMKHHKEVTIKQLLEESDYRKIYEESQFSL